MVVIWDWQTEIILEGIHMSLATKGLYISDFPGHITRSFKTIKIEEKQKFTIFSRWD